VQYSDYIFDGKLIVCDTAGTDNQSINIRIMCAEAGFIPKFNSGDSIYMFKYLACATDYSDDFMDIRNQMD